MPLKPSEQEEEYFARMEYERKKKVEGKNTGNLQKRKRKE